MTRKKNIWGEKTHFENPERPEKGPYKLTINDEESTTDNC